MTTSIRIAHVNLARGYRGGERQTELSSRGFAAEVMGGAFLELYRGSLGRNKPAAAGRIEP